MINVPTMVWIDETGRIVRANDVALVNDLFKDITGIESGPRMEALRAWARDGTLPPDSDARQQLMLPTHEEQLARTEFTLAWFLHRAGRSAAALRHFDVAASLSPSDWTIRRGSMPIRGIDPMGSMEMANLLQEWIDAGRPYYRPRTKV